MSIILQHYGGLGKCKSNLESLILSLSEPYATKLNLVLTVPGIKNLFSAIVIIAAIGVDMSVFPTAKHLCSWAGLVPQSDENAGKKHSVRISRAGVYIKPFLIQCANAIVKSDKHPEIKGCYLSIKKRRGHKRAIIAIARMLLTAIYQILKKGESYNPELYKKVDVLPASRQITVEEAISIGKKHGYSVISA